MYIYIYIYVWKLNQTVLELDFRSVKFLFFPRRNLNAHHWYMYALLNILLLQWTPSYRFVEIVTKPPVSNAEKQYVCNKIMYVKRIIFKHINSNCRGLISAKDIKGQCSRYCYMQTSSCPQQKREPCYFILHIWSYKKMNHNTYKMHIYLLIRLNIIPFENQWKIHTMKCHTKNTNPTNTFINRTKILYCKHWY
jgi:hypothetical protein